MVISDGEFVAAIVISDVTIRNEEAFQIYRSRAAESMAKFGGRYLARNGAIRVLEGDWHPTLSLSWNFRVSSRHRLGMYLRNMVRRFRSAMSRSGATSSLWRVLTNGLVERRSDSRQPSDKTTQVTDGTIAKRGYYCERSRPICHLH
jgi:uncharacterized protein (DUF1330 family)